MTQDIEIERVRAETPGINAQIHLLAAGSALMPQPVVDAVVNQTLLEARVGGYEAQARRADSLNRVYDSVAHHIGAGRHEIALMENATVAWCQAFYALPLHRGSRILTCEAEYAANYVAMLQRAKRDDLRIEVIPSDASGALDVAALEAAIRPDVGLIAITWVPTNGGLVNSAAAVGAIARKHEIPYLLDGCQAAGQMRIDMTKLGCDFFSATGRKFLRGPRGTGFLYVRDVWLDRMEPAMIDHFGAPWVARERYELRNDARRFETWENSYALRAGLGAAFDYADAVGIDAIATRVRHLADHCRKVLADMPAVRLRDLGSEHCAIVSFTVDGADAPTIAAKMKDAGIVIGTSPPSSTRLDAERRDLPHVVRIAPHYYNTEAEIEQAVQTLVKVT